MARRGRAGGDGGGVRRRRRATLAARLLAALQGAERAGGDVRGRQSAALLVVAADRAMPGAAARAARRGPRRPGRRARAPARASHRAYALAEEADELLGAGDAARGRRASTGRPPSSRPSPTSCCSGPGLSIAHAGDLDGRRRRRPPRRRGPPRLAGPARPADARSSPRRARPSARALGRARRLSRRRASARARGPARRGRHGGSQRLDRLRADQAAVASNAVSASPTGVSRSSTRAPIRPSTLRSSACAQTAPNMPVRRPDDGDRLVAQHVVLEGHGGPVERVLELAGDRAVVLRRREQDAVRLGDGVRERLAPAAARAVASRSARRTAGCRAARRRRSARRRPAAAPPPRRISCAL